MPTILNVFQWSNRRAGFRLRLSVAVGALLLTTSCAARTIRTKGFEIIRSDYSPGEITRLCDQAIAEFNKQIDLTKTAYDIDKTLSDLGDKMDPLTFMAYVSTDADLRTEASACEEKSGKVHVQVFTRRDLYQKVKDTRAQKKSDRYFLTELRKKFEQSGMALSDADLATFRSWNEELTTLESQFSKNLNEDVSSVPYAESELKGVPATFIAGLQKNKDGLLIATTKSTDFLQIMENAELPETRRKMLAAYDDRAGAVNTDLLQKAVALRARIAKLLGYKTWADYTIDGRMAKNAATALGLLNDLSVKLQPRLKKDLDRLRVAKSKAEGANAGDLRAWDLRYYINQVKKQDYALDTEVLRTYFPKDHVMSEMFKIYQTLLDVRFDEVPGAEVWNSDVKLYAIKELRGQEAIGYFYVDAFPRPGKYNHAAAFSLIQGRVTSGTAGALRYAKPVSAVVANFTAPTADRPSLLTHNEVETLFHEFGHIMHQTLTRAEFGSVSGTSVARDFVEAPSQMLEGWVWDKKMLNRISGHYQDLSKKLPSEMVKQLVRSKDFNQGYHYSRQIVLGKTDLAIHMSDAPGDVNVVFRKMHADVIGVPTIDNSRFMAGFGHMMGGYDAGYYGYLWSEVYADDMFTAFEQTGLLNSSTGKRYRKYILEPGGSQDPLSLISQFLGRTPNNRAFLKKLGL
jgi:thimet oligopeptidase